MQSFIQGKCLVFVFGLCATILGNNAVAQTKDLNIMNTSEYVGGGRYNWTVYIEAPAAILTRIDSVEYTLHPTFPNPVRIVKSRDNKFALKSNGWGEFTIFVRIFFSDGTINKYEYPLKLSKTEVKESRSPASTSSKPSVEVEKVQITAANVSSYMGNGLWDWTVFIAASDEVLSQIQYVEYTLHPSFSNPVQRVTTRGKEANKGFFFSANGWGTFQIPIKVVFKNGQARFLKHQLTFSTK